MTSTSGRKAPPRLRLWAAAVWLLLWQGASMAVDIPLLFPSPAAVGRCLLALAATGTFWASVAASAGRVLAGFLLACLLGTACAVLTLRFRRVGELLAPLTAAVKAVPVMSFILLAFLWLPGKGALTALIAFLIGFPLLYESVSAGLGAADAALLEMARVFQVPASRQARGIYLPAALPHFRAAAATAMGLCWKAGVAAEVISLPGRGVGLALYDAKIYFEVPELFAWTLTVVAASVLMERALAWLLDRLGGALG